MKGVGEAQARVLDLLKEHPEGLIEQDIMAMLDMPQPGRSLSGLASKGLVTMTIEKRVRPNGQTRRVKVWKAV